MLQDSTDPDANVVSPDFPEPTVQPAEPQRSVDGATPILSTPSSTAAVAVVPVASAGPAAHAAPAAAPRVPSPMRPIAQGSPGDARARVIAALPPEQLAAASRGDRRSLLAFLRTRRGS